MNKYNLLDCTLRDGGYVINWNFSDEAIRDITQTLINSGLDAVEVGYLNNTAAGRNSTQFSVIEDIEAFLPHDRKNALILAMADITQYLPKDLTPFTGRSIDGIRVVFYKNQVEEALIFAKAVKENGYKLFMQPMVTIDYSREEYSRLSERIALLNPEAVSIVDSFGYMINQDFRQYFRILDNTLSANTAVGIHSHNNMNFAFPVAVDVLEYNTSRSLVIDASLKGMGRAAGNLQTELIANYYNQSVVSKFDIRAIMHLVGKYIEPIEKSNKWGYSPHLFLTALHKCHPNYAVYLLDKYTDISTNEFDTYLDTIPEDMHTKCKRQYVEDMYEKYRTMKGV